MASAPPLNVLLVRAAPADEPLDELDAKLDEAASLAETLGWAVVERFVQRRRRLDPATLVGKGFAAELGSNAAAHEVGCVVFDNDLSPSQKRNLERIVGVRVADRSEMILDIFALHAKTSEAKAQVELARAQHEMTKLIGLGRALSRLGGVRGMRGGPGEKMLETDRRHLVRRIRTLKKRLVAIEASRLVQHKREDWFRVALVGYTNSGKTTLLNRLTGAGKQAGDHLFLTLDTATRAIRGERSLLTDTVGFISGIPSALVASFRSTLGVVRRANLILHVVDIAAPRIEERVRVVENTLGEVGASEIDRLTVYNKSDKLLDPVRTEDGSVTVSALTGDGIPRLLGEIAARRAASVAR